MPDGDPATLRSATLPPGTIDGSLVWDFLTAFFASRRGFQAVYRRYESRVLRFAREAGVHRDDLSLPPADLARLFYPKRLQHLRDQRLAPLRAFAHALFRESGVVEPLDTISSHVFHEQSILMEEHMSVVRFQHLSDPRRYAQVFEEVSGYYPVRLRRIRRLFADGLRRLEELLPSWAHDRVVVRSAYLFGDRMARGVWEEPGLLGLYARMYPVGGAAEGYAVAGRSFLASGFLPEASEALHASVRWARRTRPGPRRKTPATEFAAEARRLLATIPSGAAGASGPARGPDSVR
jgi:hypothetical protein